MSVSGMREAEVSLRAIFFDFNSKNNDRKILPAVSETKNPMHTQRLRALVIEKAVH